MADLRRFSLATLSWWKALFVALMLLSSAGVFGQANSQSFDHVKTGFTLKGMHANARCESCHVGGVFKGTPRDCATCHVSGSRLATSNVVRPSQHFVTQQTCDTCHSTVTFTGAKFDHLGVTSASCSSCHNGSTASGKPANHIKTDAACGTCHKTSGWIPASGMDHSGMTAATNCASCHNGSSATGKTASHISTTLNCTSCHTTSGWKPTSWNHTQTVVTNQCSTCHSGANPPADGPTANHIPYKSLTGVSVANCDSCHKGGFASWNPGKFHSNVSVSGQCATCHLTTRYGATGKPATTIHASVTGNCESCHKTTASWAATKPDHGLFNTSTNCSSCHNGSAATGKLANHLPTTGNCASCHTVNAWKPSKWNHTQEVVTGKCSTCHTGSYPPADGKPAVHIPTTVPGVVISNCDTCHRGGYASWNPGRFHGNVSVSAQCATCHLNTAFGVTGKPATSIHSAVTGNCESCHKTTSSWSASKPDHSLFTSATQCANCHNGSGATGKTGTHIPTTGNCLVCHSTTAWTPTKWNHTQEVVTAKCSTCHTGSYPPADGKPAVHIPTTVPGVVISNCDTCHRGGYASWNPGRFHGNVSVSAQCATCHLNTAFGVTGKPATTIHSAVTGNCESCHKTTSSWSASKPDHSLFNSATQCANCHNGSGATGKTGTHIPTTGNCLVCHSTTAWTPTKWNHTQEVVTAKCSTCHTGSYPPAEGKPAVHIPTSVPGVVISNCDTCHRGGYAAWNPGRFHGNVSVSAQCATCHLSTAYGVTGKPATSIHATVTGNCESCHKTTSSWSASKPDHSLYTSATQCGSCHNGSGATGKPSVHIPTASNCVVCHSTASWLPSKWNHTQEVVTSKCATCHSGSYPPAEGKPAVHIPTTVPGVVISNCDTCHRSGYASWSPGRFHGNVSVSTQCATCHLSTAYGVTGKPATSIHATVTGTCEACHKTTSSWSASKPDHSLYTSATQCGSCHNGSGATGKPSLHIPTTGNCVACHSTTGWIPSKWNHTQEVVTNKCSTCHSGNYPPADGKPANHIPYTTLSGVVISNCDTCHRSGYASWSPGRFHQNVSVATQCSTCHATSAYGLTFKPATHIPTGTTACESCHRTTAWAPATMNHAVVTATTCKTCHVATYASSGLLTKPGDHIPESTQLLGGATLDCKACHTSTTNWATQRMNHNSTPGNGAGWCKGCHVTGTNYGGNAEKMALNHRNKSPAPTDCSQSGCHKPLGGEGSSWTKWN